MAWRVLPIQNVCLKQHHNYALWHHTWQIENMRIQMWLKCIGIPQVSVRESIRWVQGGGGADPLKLKFASVWTHSDLSENRTPKDRGQSLVPSVVEVCGGPKFWQNRAVETHAAQHVWNGKAAACALRTAKLPNSSLSSLGSSFSCGGMQGTHSPLTGPRCKKNAANHYLPDGAVETKKKERKRSRNSGK